MVRSLKVILTTVGHQINNVFSNISKGLSSSDGVS
jgi:hypothetical protein